jgi:dihydropteroate synthase
MIAKLVSLEDIDKELINTGIDTRSLPFFTRKKETFLIKLLSIDAKAANILKQLFLSSGGDAAIHKEVASFSCTESDALCMGTRKCYEEVIDKLKSQPYFDLDRTGHLLLETLMNIRKRYQKQIMGIINITPDSFSDGGDYLNPLAAKGKIQEMIQDGVDILDIGGESSRPGAEAVPLGEELRRVLPAIEQAKEINKEIALSIDTTKQEVAEEALKKGATIVNTIFITESMIKWLSTIPNQFVLMHMRGNPQNMQSQTTYTDVVEEILHFFDHSLTEFRKIGIDQNRIILDPGIGFAKTPEQNMQILHHLSCFSSFGLPVMLGVSRKSFMGKIWNLPVETRDFPTQLLSLYGFGNGASIIRVHETKQNVFVKTLLASINQNA